MKSTYKRALFKKNRINFIMALIGALGNAFVAVLVAFIIKKFVDVSMLGDMKEFVYMLKMYGVLLLLTIIVGVIVHLFTNRFLYRSMLQYKQQIFHNILRKNISAFTKESSADYLSAITNDAASIETNYLQATFDLITYGLMFVMGLCTMLYMDAFLSLCVIGASMLPLILSVCFGSQLQKLETQTSQENSRFVALMKDLLNGFTVVKSFQAENEVEQNYGDANRKVERIKLKKRNMFSIISILSNVSGFLVNLVVFGLGTYLSIQGEIRAGTVIAFVQLLNYIIMPIEKLPSLYTARKASEALIDKAAKACAQGEVKHEKKYIKSFTKALQLQEVSFAYEEHNVLTKLSTSFEKGKSYAIVGASGSGKSTLLQLLQGYHADYKGHIFMDDIELNEIDTDCLLEQLSVIQQHVFVFHATIRDNITMFHDFDQEQIAYAIEASGLYELIQEKGEEYRCGENGCLLSGGEKQRISIARSLIRNTSILLMDEATASLDTKTAAMVEDAILSIPDVTKIVVTHKLNAQILRRYDEILVLHNGSICEQGSFDALYQNKGYFYSLYTISA